MQQADPNKNAGCRRGLMSMMSTAVLLKSFARPPVESWHVTGVTISDPISDGFASAAGPPSFQELICFRIDVQRIG